MDEFRISVVRVPGSSVLAVAGEFDLAGVRRFHEARETALSDGGAVIVDLSDCVFVDSTAIASVIDTFHLMGEADRPFALVGSALRRKVFELAGLPGMVPYYDTRSEALEALDRIRSPEEP